MFGFRVGYQKNPKANGESVAKVFREEKETLDCFEKGNLLMGREGKSDTERWWGGGGGGRGRVRGHLLFRQPFK